MTTESDAADYNIERAIKIAQLHSGVDVESRNKASNLGLVHVWAYHCSRCNYVWLPKDFDIFDLNGKDLLNNESPKACARCKSKQWNRLRYRNLKNYDGEYQFSKGSKFREQAQERSERTPEEAKEEREQRAILKERLFGISSPVVAEKKTAKPKTKVKANPKTDGPLVKCFRCERQGRIVMVKKLSSNASLQAIVHEDGTECRFGAHNGFDHLRSESRKNKKEMEEWSNTATCPPWTGQNGKVLLDTTKDSIV